MKRFQGKELIAALLVLMFIASTVTPAWADVVPEPILEPQWWTGGIINITQMAQMQVGGGATRQTGEQFVHPYTWATGDNRKTIYFGQFWQNVAEDGDKGKLSNYTKEGVKWRVLSVSKTGEVFLLSDKGLYADAFGSNNVYADSSLRKTLNDRTQTTFNDDKNKTVKRWGGFAGDAFNEKEYSAIKNTSLSDVGSTDKIFILSNTEADNGDYGFKTTEDKSGWHPALTAPLTMLSSEVHMYFNENKASVSDNSGKQWLRTPVKDSSTYEYDVNYIEGISPGVDVTSANDHVVRPAFNLDANMVLFLSAAEATKSDGTSYNKNSKSQVSVGDGFALAGYDGSNGWKVTLLDEYDEKSNPSGIMAPTGVTVTQGYTGYKTLDELAEKTSSSGETLLDLTNGLSHQYGGAVTVAYSGKDAKADFVSAIVATGEGTADNPYVYENYAKISDQTSETGKTVGTSNLSPNKEYTMFVFAEQTNGDYLTDYASATQAFKINTSGTLYEGKLSNTYGTKGLTAKLGSGFKLAFDYGTYNTNVTVQDEQTATIKGSETATATTLTGGINIGEDGEANDILTLENFFNVQVDASHKIDNYGILENNGILFITGANSSNNLGYVTNNGVMEFAGDASSNLTLQNGGTWYVSDATATQQQVTMSTGGAIDLAYTNLQVKIDADGKQVADPTYDDKSSFTTLNVENLFIENNGLLKIQSDVEHDKADRLNVTTLNFNDNSELHIQVMNDSYFANGGALSPKSIVVFSGNIDLSNLNVIGVATEQNGVRFTPHFGLTNENYDIVLTGFDYRAIHVYDLQKQGTQPWTKGTSIPYGSIVKKGTDGNSYLYKIVTGTGLGKPWGRVGRELDNVDESYQKTLNFYWDNTSKTLKEAKTAADPKDITVIYNDTNATSDHQTSFVDATGDAFTAFVGAKNEDFYAEGGAVYIENANYGSNVEADFLGNYASGSFAYGGAICNRGTISGTITGDFLSNYAKATGNNEQAIGGAIYTLGTGSIIGDFLGNYVLSTNSDAKGGAIYTSTTGSITGDFLGNYALASRSAYGGAIANSGEITGAITGDFLGNYASGSSAYGGAIYNEVTGSIGGITGNFLGNYASGSSGAFGGAICNRDTNGSATIGSITGNFQGNYALGYSAKGGAIYNDSTITGAITGDFLGNYASGSSGAYGGAIYNDSGKNAATIAPITGDFIDNSAISTSDSGNSTAFGGAIYNKRGKITILAGTQNILFSGNKVSVKSGTALGGAIYNDGDDTVTTIKLYAGEGKSITFAGSATDASVDSVHNEGNIYINDTDRQDDMNNAYTGTVEFATITDRGTPRGKMFIKGGTVNFKGDVTQSKVDVTANANINLFSTSDVKTISGAGSTTINDAATLKGNFTGTGTVTNKGTWYPVFSKDTETGEYKSDNAATVTLSDGGTIDIAYSDLTKDATTGKFVPTYDKKDNYVTTAVSGFVINNGVLKIQSDEASGKVDSLTANNLTLGDGARLDIEVIFDPNFGAPTDKIAVLTADSITGSKKLSSALTVTGIRNGRFTAQFALDDKNIYLTGFDMYHYYELVDTEVRGSVTAPYGYVYLPATNTLYKIKTKDSETFGHGTDWQSDESKRVTKYFNWHTATSDTDHNYLEEQEGTTGDIVFTYDGENVSTQRRQVTDIYKAYVGCLSYNDSGGAINNYSAVYDGNIQADFLGNYVLTTAAHGGAIYNGRTITGAITGDFLGNYAMATDSTASGGAIYNSYYGFGTAKIGSIAGDFIGNFALTTASQSRAEGGAIDNNGGEITGSIIGDFLGNYAWSASETSGGAIYNTGTIGAITGDFLGNYAISTAGVSSNHKAYGGAIYNTKTISWAITGDFIGNYASATGTGGSAYGGAIYNTGTIGSITGDFLGNYVSATGTGGYAYGGAIYNGGTIKVLAANQNVLFSGNYVSAPNGTALGGAIYNKEGATLKLYAGDGYSITFAGSDTDALLDSIHNEGTLYINGDGTESGYTGTVNLATITDKTYNQTSMMSIYGGTVNLTGTLTQKALTIEKGATMVAKADDINITGEKNS